MAINLVLLSINHFSAFLFVPGVTGGEEDGVDNTDVDSSRLYTQPEEVWQVYETLSAVPNGNFTVAAAFGNVHGIYAPGNVPTLKTPLEGGHVENQIVP